ncbi:MAG: NUDIX hydrolase [Pseudomonadales bacterium]|nr:NUDIX hydrolase [Pseudomonadales bacterium]MBL6808891.1 NUDIX hydrolase [Pseudomonadales bacterium]
MSETNPPKPPVPAGTIVLLREGTAGPEMFMVVRHHQIDFASGALVFPGGKVDAQDDDPELEALCFGAAADPVLRAIEIGSIREAFEEAGVLLARREGETALLSGDEVAALDRFRDPLHKGELSLKAFLRQEKLRLACDALTRFAHWVTPTMMPKRFDTHFFLAIAPTDQVLAHDGHESVDSVWLTPARALADAEAGRRTVIFPTLRNIEILDGFAGCGALIDAFAGKPIVTVTPWTEKRDDGTWLCIPPEAGYKLSEEKMTSMP